MNEAYPKSIDLYPVITNQNKLGRESVSTLKNDSPYCVGLKNSDIFK